MSPEDARMLKWASSHHPSCKAKIKYVPFKGTTILEYLIYIMVALGMDLFMVYLLFLG